MKDLLTNPQIVDHLLELGLAVLTLLGLLATKFLLRWFNESELRQVEVIARQAVAYAEEWARARAKGGPRPSSSEKMATAMEAVKTLAKGRLARMAQEKWGIALHAQLPSLRASLPPPPVQPMTSHGAIRRGVPSSPAPRESIAPLDLLDRAD